MRPMFICSLFVASALCCASSCSEKQPLPEEPSKPVNEFEEVVGGEEVLSIEAVNCEKVSRVIGNTPNGETLPNPNSSFKRFGIASTDFGNMWDAGNGTVFCVFGDNFNDMGGDWLSNAIAITSDKKLEDGLYYDSMLWDKQKNKRMEIINSGEDPSLDTEATCIPTNGFSVQTAFGRRQYLSYMSIRQWKVDGINDKWACNYSQLVYSDDFGNSWTRSGVKWDGEGNFVQCAFSVQDGMVYMWGTPSGRFGQVHVARVAQADVLDKGSYEYWNGSSWVHDELAAVPVTNGTVSEFSVAYNTYYKRYIMMYLSVNQRKLVYRDASSPQGEWSAEKILLDGTYGPSIHPWFCDGRDLWFVSSSVTNGGHSYDTWHIFLYHAKLRADEDGFNMVWEPGFEYDPDQGLSFKTLWNCPDAITSHDAHSGKTSLKIVNSDPSGWKDGCTQKIAVRKNTDYRLSAFLKASADCDGKSYVGARLPDGNICDSSASLAAGEWKKIEVEFNSGDNTELTVFFGTWGQDGLSVLVDDFHLSPSEK